MYNVNVVSCPDKQNNHQTLLSPYSTERFSVFQLIVLGLRPTALLIGFTLTSLMALKNPLFTTCTPQMANQVSN